MKLIRTSINDLVVLKPNIFNDRRGYFMEIFNQKKIIELLGDITFVHSAMGQRNFDVFEKGMLTMTPQPGMMIMFPSYLLHTVWPFIGDGERRCIAFNANYRIGDENKSFIAGDLSGVQNATFYTKEKGKS